MSTGLRTRTCIMRRLAAACACAAAFVVASSSAFAQVQPDTGRVRLDTLLVGVTRGMLTADRVPAAVSSVGLAGIRDARTMTGLHEALAGVPGLVVANRQNYSLGSRIVVRGLGARAAFGVRGVRVVVDGIPLTMPDGQTNLNNLDLGSAGAIHVLRGPASSLFGNAAGGVIAVETEPAPGPFSGEARVTLGDLGRGDASRLMKAQAKVGQTIGGVDYIVSASRLEVDGYRAHSASTQTLLNTRVGFALGEATRLGALLSVIDMPVAQNPGALPLDSARRTPTMAWAANERAAAGESTRQLQLGTRLVHERDALRGDVILYGLRRSLENPLSFGFIDLDRTAGGVRGVLERRFDGVALAPALTVGVDVEAQWDDRREFANQGGTPVGDPRRDQQDHVATLGPFAQLRFGTGALGVVLGTRFDFVRFRTDDRRTGVTPQSGERTLHAVSPSAGVTWTRGATTVFANVGSAFQTPTTTELLNTPPAPGQPCCPAGFNPDLEPQRAVSTEVGVRGGSGRLRYEAVAFLMRVTDALVPFQVAGVEGRDFFRNAARTRHAGVELSTSLALTERLAASAVYAWTDVTFREDGTATNTFRGNRMPGVPPHRARGALTWSAEPLRLTAELDHTAAQHVNDANTAPPSPAATLLSLRASTRVPIGRITLAPFAAIENLLDEQYFGSVTVNAAAARFYEPAPGRSFHFGASLLSGAWERR